MLFVSWPANVVPRTGAANSSLPFVEFPSAGGWNAYRYAIVGHGRVCVLPQRRSAILLGTVGAKSGSASRDSRRWDDSGALPVSGRTAYESRGGHCGERCSRPPLLRSRRRACTGVRPTRVPERKRLLAGGRSDGTLFHEAEEGGGSQGARRGNVPGPTVCYAGVLRAPPFPWRDLCGPCSAWLPC